jgi:hypothetical protein
VCVVLGISSCGRVSRLVCVCACQRGGVCAVHMIESAPWISLISFSVLEVHGYVIYSGTVNAVMMPECVCDSKAGTV